MKSSVSSDLLSSFYSGKMKKYSDKIFLDKIFCKISKSFKILLFDVFYVVYLGSLYFPFYNFVTETVDVSSVEQSLGVGDQAKTLEVGRMMQPKLSDEFHPSK